MIKNLQNKLNQKIPLLIFLFLTACTSNSSTSTSKKTSDYKPVADHQKPFQSKPDTFDYDKPEHLIAFLKKRSENQNTSFCFHQKHEFHATSFSHIPPLPTPAYDRISPRNEDLKNANSQKLYGINDLEQHIQLILAGNGKYLPYLQLFTLSKPDLKLIDTITVFHSFVDAGEIDIILGCLSEDFKHLNVWNIHNSTTKSNWELADTLELNYQIMKKGKIKKIH